MLGFSNMNVRFFVECENEVGEIDIKEVTEYEFLQCDKPVIYDRHTVFENGVKQICLTKIES